METISNAATTASKMIWGESKNQESGTEPVSGQTGKDSGAASADTGAPSSLPETKAAAGENPASSGAHPEQKQQGADRPNDPPTGKSVDAVAEKKDEGEEALKKRDPADHSGEPLTVHDDGEAAAQSDRKTSKAGQPGGGQHGKEEGTGEKWVKSSGVAADGGDFDVSNPGAGREAGRLLEQKGVHRTVDSPAPPPPSGDSAGGSSGGSSGGGKMDKLKEKLHIGGKH